MNRYFTLIVSLLIFQSISLAQDNVVGRIKKVIVKDGYYYIPINSINDSTIGLQYYYDIPFGSVRTRDHLIIWKSSCIDGTYELTITPEQIYLINTHENPNPNQFFWLYKIDGKTYAAISEGLKKRKFKKRLNLITSNAFHEENRNLESLNDSIGSKKSFDCDTFREQVTDNIITLLNEMVADKCFKIDKINKIVPDHKIFYGASEEEINGMVNFLIETKK